MFVLPKNADDELWDGPRTGVEGVKEIFGADEAFESKRFTEYLKHIMSSHKHVFMDSPGKVPTLLSDVSSRSLNELGRFYKKSCLDIKRIPYTCKEKH